jgi:agmatinase
VSPVVSPLATPSAPPFLGARVVLEPESVDTPYAFLGVPFGPPYAPQDLTVCAGAADAVRAMAHRMEYGQLATHHDFDLGEPLFPDGLPTVCDCGDVVGDVRAPDRIADTALDVLSRLVAGGRTPLVVGGLDSVPPMVAGAFVGREQIHVLHVDAHLDFRDEVGGVRDGYSSPVRRIRELACVDRIVQVGLRSVGSARPADLRDAVASGNRVVTAWELRESGLPAFVDSLPTDRRWLVTIDCDGLDPSIAPGVGWPEPGGLTFPEIAGVLRHLSRAGRVAAVAITEFQPALDIRDLTALTITRLLVNVLGLQRSPGPVVGPQ